MTLLARYYERYADHAVAVAGRISYLVTGQSISQAAIDREDLEDRMPDRLERSCSLEPW